MRATTIRTAMILALGVPTLAVAQTPVDRVGSWEFSIGGGITVLDRDLLDALAAGPATTRFTKSADPGRVLPTGAVRVGYNFSNNLGFSIGAALAGGSGVTYLSPQAAVTYTINLNAKTSPFLMAGLQGTRISGQNGNRAHPTWGAHLGLGVRSMVSERVALRLEGRVAREYYQRPSGVKAAFIPVAILGLSYFAGGRHAPAEPMMSTACNCPAQRTRVDTVRITVVAPPAPRPPIVLRDTLVLEGVNFDYDKAELLPDDKEILDRVAVALLEPQWAAARFEVAGHTSGIGTAQYNMDLSVQRANVVAAYLVSKGVPASRLTARGYGELSPLYPNDSEGRNWKNRRVELRRRTQ
ncbi:MAG: OmpA family protein [Gemmatimonadota bacterium]